jgi:DNA-binding NarL/FixJ family response regulator
MIKVLIVEDHPLLVEGLKKSFGNVSDIELIAAVGSGKECREIVKNSAPDIILMDLRLSDTTGMELTKEILELNSDIKIIVFSNHHQKFYVQSMLDLGVKSYLLKSVDFSEILAAVYAVNSGGKYFCKEIAIQIKEDKNNPIFVTKREQEVLKLIADGLTNQDIADKLFISPLTVDSHRKNLILKFDAKNTPSMINAAIVQGFL